MVSRDPMIAPRFVSDQMAQRGILQAVLAERIGRTQGWVSKVLAGTQPIPWDDLDQWAAALELTPEQITLFKRYCIRSYGPPCANECVDALDNARAELAALGREVATQHTAIAALKDLTVRLERENADLRAQLDAVRRPSAG